MRRSELGVLVVLLLLVTVVAVLVVVSSTKRERERDGNLALVQLTFVSVRIFLWPINFGGSAHPLPLLFLVSLLQTYLLT